MSTVLIPYRGDLVTARLGYKAAKKQTLRKFKRKLIDLWDMNSKLYLWAKGQGYVNDKARDLLGIEKDFMTDSTGITGFGVELKPSADVSKVLALDDEQKDFLRTKCIAIFNKYGYTVKTSYKDGGFDFQTFLSDGTETEFNGEDDEELASILYDRLVMYMIDNDSTDTVDSWSDNYENQSDFFDNDIRSKLRSYKCTFTSADILKMVNDRLFTKRTYRTIGGTAAFKYTVTAQGIDMDLFNELLDGGTTDNVDSRYWDWNGSTYSLRVDDVKALGEDEFMIFLQTHLGTFTDKEKKKWYQKGVWGIVFAVVIVVIAVITQQYYLVGVALGTAIVVAGMVISLTGALIGNEVMVVAGQIVSLIGGGINLTQSIMANQAAIVSAQQLAVNVGADNLAVQQIVSGVINDMMLDTALGVAKFAISTYSTISTLTADPNTEQLNETVTPAEKINEVYVADDMSWDYVQQFLPDFIIANTLRIM